MRVLVIGSGGREHAIVWKVSQSPKVSQLFCAPGNGGISDIAICVPINAEDIENLVSFCKKERIDLAIVGPENPLAFGLVDKFLENGIVAFGPTKNGALIESSKVFAKSIMKKYKIPTADYVAFDEYEDAKKYIMEKDPPFVVKADGLCAGKGSYVISNRSDALVVLENIFLKKVHGDAGKKVIIEECLFGDEVSYLAFSDGKTILPLVPSQDHKRLLDNDLGPNTGGMGAYAPIPFVSSELEEIIKKDIMVKAICGLKDEGIKYKGILYAGLMIVGGYPYVLEFNARFGDPETQAILFQMESDLLPIIMACVNESLEEVSEIRWRKGYAVCVVIASKGYPENPEKGKLIEGIDSLKGSKDVIVFHAGTKKVDGSYYTSGGRVLNVVARGDDLSEAIKKAYEAVSLIYFEGMQFRKDIGKKALEWERRMKEVRDG